MRVEACDGVDAFNFDQTVLLAGCGCSSEEVARPSTKKEANEAVHAAGLGFDARNKKTAVMAAFSTMCSAPNEKPIQVML